tara:strand:+ start:219 stop:416 length:198 start_codon:yes stop_codon:yes gene_type:complete
MSVSRLQARFNKSGGKVYIYDLVLNAGTSVNQLEVFCSKRMKVWIAPIKWSILEVKDSLILDPLL